MPPDFRPLLHQTPTHADTEDRFLFGLTGRQFLLAVVSVVLAYGLWDWMGPSWPPLMRAIPPLVLAAMGLTVALPGQGAGPILGVRFRAPQGGHDPPRHRLAPLQEGLVSGAPAVAPAEPRRPGERAGDALPDRDPGTDIRLVGHEYRAVVECVGVAVHHLPMNEQEATLAGYAAFLNALPFPSCWCGCSGAAWSPTSGTCSSPPRSSGRPETAPWPGWRRATWTTSAGCTSRPCSWTGAAMW